MNDYMQFIDDQIAKLGKHPFKEGEIEQLTPTSNEMLEKQING